MIKLPFFFSYLSTNGASKRPNPAVNRGKDRGKHGSSRCMVDFAIAGRTNIELRMRLNTCNAAQ